MGCETGNLTDADAPFAPDARHMINHITTIKAATQERVS
jgi:hypothetical protein